MGTITNGSTGSVGSTGSTGSTGATGSAGASITGSVIYPLPGTYTWIVPYYIVLTIELWGAGGSGGSAYNGYSTAAGGEGGDYKKYTSSSGQLTVGSSITLIIGTGGIENRSNGLAGYAGGYTVFGDRVWAQGGDGGGGQFVGGPAAASYAPGTAHSFTLVTSENGGTNGYNVAGGNVTYAGGGGGGAQNAGPSWLTGGTSTYGGRGGDGMVYFGYQGSDPAGGGGAHMWSTGGSRRGGHGRIALSWTV